MVLCRCYIFGGHAELVTLHITLEYAAFISECDGHFLQAWNFYLSKETSGDTLILLNLIATECFRVGEYWIAAKAFDMLEKFS